MSCPQKHSNPVCSCGETSGESAFWVLPHFLAEPVGATESSIIMLLSFLKLAFLFLNCFSFHFFSPLKQAKRLQGQLGCVCPCHLPGLPRQVGAWAVASVPAALSCVPACEPLSALSRCLIGRALRPEARVLQPLKRYWRILAAPLAAGEKEHMCPLLWCSDTCSAFCFISLFHIWFSCDL